MINRTTFADRFVHMTSMIRLGDFVGGRFRVDAAGAEGGMGVVYRGRDLETDRVVAIKVLREELVESIARFTREAELLATIDDPGIVRHVAHGVENGSPYLVMDWIEGPTLASWLADRGLTPAESIDVVHRLASSLATAHARGLVHRDIKPQNVVFADGVLERPMLVDFGLARLVSDHQRLTMTGAVVGTPGHMAPEQAMGKRDVDARTDVFALGCLLYECLVGFPAFGGRNATAVMTKIVLWQPPSVRELVPELPALVDDIVVRTLAKVPTERPHDAAEVARLLAAAKAPTSPRRRRMATDDAATVVDRCKPEMTHLVLLRGPEVASDLIEQAMASRSGTLIRLVDDTAIVLLSGRTAELSAIDAASCALALRAIVPRGVIVIAGPDGEHASLVAQLDEAGDALERADYDVMFGGGRPGEIRIDPASASRVRGRFEIREERGIHYLVAEAA